MTQLEESQLFTIEGCSAKVQLEKVVMEQAHPAEHQTAGEFRAGVGELALTAVKVVPVVAAAFGTRCRGDGREERHLY